LGEVLGKQEKNARRDLGWLRKGRQAPKQISRGSRLTGRQQSRIRVIAAGASCMAGSTVIRRAKGLETLPTAGRDVLAIVGSRPKKCPCSSENEQGLGSKGPRDLKEGLYVPRVVKTVLKERITPRMHP
jgi:hypothetical protein